MTNIFVSEGQDAAHFNDLDDALILKSLSDQLPELPAVIQYDDDYASIIRAIINPKEQEYWEFKTDGELVRICWYEFSPLVEKFARCWLAWDIQFSDPSSVKFHIPVIQKLAPKLPEILAGISRTTEDARNYWESVLLIESRNIAQLTLCKLFLKFMCMMNLGPWTPSHENIVSKWGYGAFKRVGKYKGVVSQDVIVSIDEERKLIEYFDSLNMPPTGSNFVVSYEDLRSSAILYWSYQHGFRPIQIASLELKDVVIRNSREQYPIVHATFYKAKQRKGEARTPMRRSSKREWAPMLKEYFDRRIQFPEQFVLEHERPNSFFGLSPRHVSLAIQKMSERITGKSRSANEFRHSAAQKLVDAGGSQIELSEFLGHNSIDTGLVYFDTSPTQADRINKALGLSPIYTRVSEIALNRSITAEELKNRPDSQQIGAVPHGIMITGIGACDVGQSLCSKNPALSCYTCSKFLPLADKSVHEQVRDDLRPVVKQFVAAGRGDASNPAFMQLRSTLEAIEVLVVDEVIGE